MDLTPTPITHEFITGSEFVAKLTGAAMRIIMSRPMTIAVFAIAAIGLIVSVAAVLNGFPADFLVFFFALLLILWPVTLYVSLRRGFRKAIPIGTRYAIGLGETSMAVQGPLANSEISYSAFQSVTRRDEFVVLRARQGRNYSFLPVQLFAGSEFDRLVAGIGRAQN